MFDREVAGINLIFLLVAAAGIPLALGLVIVALVQFWRRRIRPALAAGASIPLVLFLSWTALDYGCVSQVVAVDISSPTNEHRARTIVRDAGATTSWSLRVEVGHRGLLSWKWTPVFRTYRDIPIEIAWRDNRTLVIRSRASKYREKLVPENEGVQVVFEDCPPERETEPWHGPYVNGCFARW